MFCFSYKIQNFENFQKTGIYVKGTMWDTTLFKAVFYTEVVCQKIQHVPLVMSIIFSIKILRSLQEINA